MKEYLPNQFCVECRGDCCKAIPPPHTPKDVFKIFGDVDMAIRSGKVAIDRWEGKELYFLRPRVKGVSKLVDYSWGGECIHLSSTGCVLPRKQRPTYCKRLEPKKTKDAACSMHIKKENEKYWAGISWKKSNTDLLKYVNFKDRNPLPRYGWLDYKYENLQIVKE